MEASHKTEELLEEATAMSEKLREQQAELQQANVEMEQVNEELQQSNVEMEEKATVLQEQREALERANREVRSEEHTSELQSLMRISYAVFCLKKKKKEE